MKVRRPYRSLRFNPSKHRKTVGEKILKKNVKRDFSPGVRGVHGFQSPRSRSRFVYHERGGSKEVPNEEEIPSTGRKKVPKVKNSLSPREKFGAPQRTSLAAERWRDPLQRREGVGLQDLFEPYGRRGEEMSAGKTRTHRATGKVPLNTEDEATGAVPEHRTGGAENGKNGNRVWG